MITRKHRLLTPLFAVLILFASALAGSGYNNYYWVKPGDNAEPGELTFKIKSQYYPLSIEDQDGEYSTGVSSIDEVLIQYNIYNLHKTFYMPSRVQDNPYADDLDRWYNIYFPKEHDLIEVISSLDKCSEIEVTDFIILYDKLDQPNDALFRQQWHLDKCNLEEAWDISHGSVDVSIGIVDGGADLPEDDQIELRNHPDLVPNLWINHGEDITENDQYDIDDLDFEDNEDNGFYDDIIGWDFTGRDFWPNDPWEDQGGGHGTHVAGIASAATNNEIGVAGAGWDCRVMICACYHPDDSSKVYRTDEGIAYCGVNQADVINCSFGHDGPESPRQTDVVEFCFEEGCVIFAGAGNDNVLDYPGREDRFGNEIHFYPCALPNVIGVGATDNRDHRAMFSNYGSYTDVFTPGVDILATYPLNDYVRLQGTSMASPFAAGIGALFISAYPGLSAPEIQRKMQISAVNIAGINDEEDGVEYRLDAAALLGLSRPDIDVTSIDVVTLEGDDDGYPESGERVRLDLELMNLPEHRPAEGVTYTISSNSPRVHFTRNHGNIGDLDGGDEIDLPQAQCPIFRVSWTHPHIASFTVTFQAGDWEITDEFELMIGHPYYILIDDDGSPTEGQNGPEDVGSYYVEDFTEIGYTYDHYDMFAEGWPPMAEDLLEYEVVVWFTGDDEEPLNEDEVIILQDYISSPDAKLILIGQYIGNQHGDSELFSDYLKVEHWQDVVPRNNRQQVYGVDGHSITDAMQFLLLGGVGAGNNNAPSSMNPLEGSESILVYNDLDESAGVYTEGDNGAQVIYLGFPLESASGLGGTTTRDQFLRTAMDYMFTVGVEDEQRELNLPSEFSLSDPWPNPFNATTEVSVSIPQSGMLNLDVVDIRGRVVAELHSGSINAGYHNFVWNAGTAAAGEYFFRLASDQGSVVKKVVLVK